MVCTYGMPQDTTDNNPALCECGRIHRPETRYKNNCRYDRDPEKREEENQKSRIRQSELRSDPDYNERRLRIDNEARREKMEDPEYREKRNAVARKWYEKDPSTKQKNNKNWYDTMPYEQKEEYLKRTSDTGRESRKNNRMLCIEHYGEKCMCECGCDQSIPSLLTLAHPNNDGARDREEHGNHLYDVLVRNNFEHPYSISLECWNCNCGKRMNGGICPKMPEI